MNKYQFSFEQVEPGIRVAAAHCNLKSIEIRRSIDQPDFPDRIGLCSPSGDAVLFVPERVLLGSLANQLALLIVGHRVNVSIDLNLPKPSSQSIEKELNDIGAQALHLILASIRAETLPQHRSQARDDE